MFGSKARNYRSLGSLCIASLLYIHMQVMLPRKIYKVPLYYSQTHEDLWCQQVTPKAYIKISIQLLMIPKFVQVFLSLSLLENIKVPVTVNGQSASQSISQFHDEQWIWCYTTSLRDIFGQQNYLNIKLQGRCQLLNVMCHSFWAFQMKL